MSAYSMCMIYDLQGGVIGSCCIANIPAMQQSLHVEGLHANVGATYQAVVEALQSFLQGLACHVCPGKREGRLWPL